MFHKDLIQSYDLNKKELSNFPNSCNLFAYPFGRPDTCFSNRQTKLLLKTGVKNIFTTKTSIDKNPGSALLHRICLTNFNNTEPLIMGQIFWYHSAGYTFLKKWLPFF